MQKINLNDVRQGFKSKTFGALIKYLLDTQKQETRIQAMMGTIDMLPEKMRPLVKDIIEHWNCRIHDRAFWQLPCNTAFDKIVEDAEDTLSRHNILFNDEALFHIFNLVALNYAYTACNQPQLQKLMSIHDFPWISAAFSLYPIAAALYVYQKHIYMTAFSAATWGLVNLGYVIFFASVFRGTFGFFGLYKRTHTFAAGIAAIVIGIVLTNIGR